jgi:hypothetical protein
MFKKSLTTGIGSLPHSDPKEACRLILDTFEIPFWPQLPRLSFKELMIPQYSEGMPFLRIGPEKQAIWVDRDSSDELQRFYESYIEDCRIAISEDYALGLHTFLEVIRNRKFEFVKGHVTGPLTFTLGLKDKEGKAVFFDEEFREISLLLLQAKTRWQIDLLRPFADSVIIFIDEPILSALGSSSYLGVSGEEALRLLKEMTSVIVSEGCVPGIHCCGNADWPMVIQSGAEIVSFDAYDYVDTIAIYHEEFRNFMIEGGSLAWGIIPTSEAIIDESHESIKERFLNGIDKLSHNIPESLLRSQMLLTPSCGTGSRTVEETIKVFQLLMRLREELS